MIHRPIEGNRQGDGQNGPNIIRVKYCLVVIGIKHSSGIIAPKSK